MVETNVGYNPQDQFKNGNSESKVAPALIQGVVKSLDRYIARHYEGSRTLKDKQMTVFEAMRDFLNDGETEGYVKLPTGVGKTVLFTEFIEATRLKTLIVVPTTILVNQTGEKIEQFAEGLDIGKIYQAAKQFGKEVTITTYDSFMRNLSNGKLNPKDYELLILDEVHESKSKPREAAVKKFTNAIKLGFSATPGNIKFLKEIHSMNIREAVEEDLLSSFSVLIAQSDVDLTNVPITYKEEYNEEELRKAVDVYNRNQGAVDLYKKMFDEQRAITYCVGVNHAEKMASLFREAGISSETISGRNTDKEKDDILNRFKNGDIRVLCNADILIQGFDEPRASVCLNLRPTFSAELAEQRGGRVLRKDPDNIQKHAYIVDFFDRAENPKKLPISFAQVAEGVFMISRRGKGVDNKINEGSKSSNGQTEIIINPGLKVITDAEEVLRVIQEMESKKYQPAPEGWMTRETLSKIAHINRMKLKQIVDEYRKEHPEWFNLYIAKHPEMVVEHLSPEIAELIIEKFGPLSKPPEGWKNFNQILSGEKRNSYTISRIIEEYREVHPEWFGQFKGRTKNALEFYSPELTKEVERRILEERKLPPEGWMNVNFISKDFGRAPQTIKSRADQYRKDHPEWFRSYIGNNKKILEYYHPDLVAKLKEESSISQVAPEGWMTKNTLKKNLSKDAKLILRIADQYRKDHPEWFQQYFSKAGIAEHYHPELIAQVERDLLDFQSPPEGWMTTTALRFELGVNPENILAEVNTYRKDHPEWFHKYFSTGGLTERYHPDLVVRLRENFASRIPAPQGWMTKNALGNILGRDRGIIMRRANAYRKDHPEWFNKQFSGKAGEYYHPELIDQIKKDLGITSEGDH